MRRRELPLGLTISWRGAVALAAVAACSDPPRASVDAAIDTATPVCQTCGSNQICVARYDGTCRGGITCVARTIDCPNNACSAACESTYCGAPFQCQTRTPCGKRNVLSLRKRVTAGHDRPDGFFRRHKRGSARFRIIAVLDPTGGPCEILPA